jgi:hypothetical protein
MLALNLETRGFACDLGLLLSYGIGRRSGFPFTGLRSKTRRT